MLLDILKNARDEGLNLFVEQGRLKYSTQGKSPSEKLVERIKNNKDDIISFLEQQNISAKDTNLIPNHGITEGPLTQNQLRIFYQNSAFDIGGTYEIAMAYVFDGLLEPDRLSMAFREILERHEILRSRFFVNDDGTPAQQVLPNDETVFTLCHSTSLSKEKWLENCSQQGCDIQSGQMIKASLLHSEKESYLYISCHHIGFDGWSCGNLLRELSELYADQAKTPPKSRIQFLDYAKWCKSQDQSQDCQKYWTDHLAGATALNSLATDRPRAAQASFSGQMLRRTLPTELSSGIDQLAQKANVSRFSAYMAAFFVLLARFTSRQDCTIGTPVSGRNQPQLYDMIGFFANVLPMRMAVDDQQSFTELLKQTQKTNLNAQHYQGLDFEALIRDLGFAGETAFTPLTQIVFSFDQDNNERLTLGALSGTKIPLGRHHAAFEIHLDLVDRGDKGLEARWLYSDALYAPETIAAFADAYADALTWLLRFPDKPVKELPLQSSQPLEGEKVVSDWPNTLTEWFDEAVGKYSTRIAVQDDREELSFADLAQRTDQMAALLHEQELEPSSCLALFFPPDVNFTAIILAAFRRGVTIVPIDVKTPIERLRHILQDADVKTIFASQETREILEKAGFEGRVILSDTSLSATVGGISHPPVDRGSIATIYYTSGSTGKPKGAQASHGGLINLMQWLQSTFTIDGKIAQKNSPAFDLSLWEILWSLFSGQTLRIVQDEARDDPSLLGEYVEREQIAALIFVPVGLRIFLDGLGDRTCDSLTHIFCGGGELTSDLARDVMQKLPNVKLVNIYGATECSIFSTSHTFNPAQDTGYSIPIGRPMNNTKIVLLDEQDRMVPRGAIGELYIGGTGVGLGYLNRGNEVFRPEVCGLEGPWYQTGDLARQNTLDQLEFIGRKDFQIKLNGFRIEPGEVEAALLNCGCSEALVMVCDETLTAYVTGIENRDALKAQLFDHLPVHMIPSFIVVLETFPVNTSGKIDRDALPHPRTMALTDAVNQTAPRDAIELSLYEIWKSVLLHPSIGIRDNFFDIGGTSISAIKLLHKIKEKMGQTLSLRTIITNPTIEDLGSVLRTTGDAGQTEEALITFRSGQGDVNVVCIHPAGGTAFCYLSLAKVLDQNVGVYGLQALGLNEGEPLSPTVETMAQHFLKQIEPLTSSHLVLTGLSFGGMVAHEMGRILAERGKTDISIVFLDTRGTDDTELKQKITPVDMEDFRSRLVRFNGTYPGISDDQIERYFDVYNHNRLCMRDYEVPITKARTVFIQAHSELPRPELHKMRRYWKSRTAGEYLARLVRGDHWDMLETDELKIVRQIIMQEISRFSLTSESN